MAITPVLARIDDYVDVPVAPPSGLPAGTLAFRKPGLYTIHSIRQAQLELKLPDGRVLVVHYGHGGFDGCGTPHGACASTARLG